MKKFQGIPVGLVALLASGTAATAATNVLSLGVSFQHTVTVIPALAPGDVAGVVPQANWNNAAAEASGSIAGLNADFNGAAVASAVGVEWVSNNTWASTGAGEENNGFPAGANHTLMGGYLDTEAATTTTVSITGIPADIAAIGYDVYVYALGGVAGRGGTYTIGGTTFDGVTPANPDSFIENSNYFVFRGLTSTDFTLEASTAVGGVGTPPRAPVNAIQIVQVPEPSAAAVLVAVGGVAVLRRRRQS